MPQSASSGRQHTAKTLLKKQQQKQQPYLQQAGRRFIGGAETAGSEADESHVANSEAPIIRRKGQSNNSSRPKQQYVTSLQPDDTEADEHYSTGSGTGRGGTASFDDDFDFSRGLAQFNKQAVFDEIRGADRTDPSHRLVAHNKKSNVMAGQAVNKYTTKLRYDENVLEAEPEPEVEIEAPVDDGQETESEAPHQTQQYEVYYSSVDDSSILPRDSVTEGGVHTTDNETIASGDYPATRQPLRASQYPGQSRANGPGSAMLASAAAAAIDVTSPASSSRGGKIRQMITEQGGIPLQAISDRTWREVQQLCTIECGPNLVQRVENGARGIGEPKSTLVRLPTLTTSDSIYYLQRGGSKHGPSTRRT